MLSFLYKVIAETTEYKNVILQVIIPEWCVNCRLIH